MHSAKKDTPAAPAATEPEKSESKSHEILTQHVPEGPKPDESEEDFMARLSAEMEKVMSSLSDEAGADKQSPQAIAEMGKQLEEFTRNMEEQGIKPEDLLKAIMGEEEGSKLAEAAHEEHDRRESEKSKSKTSPAVKDTKASPSSFEDTIRRTMSRLDESNTSATAATQKSSQSKSEEDLLADMLKSLEAGGDGNSEEGLSKIFLDMMHQLTHKEMLYEPMKELDDQYPSWLEANTPQKNPKISQDDYDKYVKQSKIVKQIVGKFEEPSYKDEDDKCREFIWERMQEMQAEGAPPEELVKNPFPGTDFGAIPGLGGDGPGESCPTQ